jgi:hypothetical protein
VNASGRLLLFVAALAAGIGLGLHLRGDNDAVSRAERTAAAANAFATIQAMSFPTPQEGSARVQGRVTTRDGKPLAEVSVVGLPRPPTPTTEAEKVEDSVRAAVARHRWIAAGRREARTDAKGAFELAGLADSPYVYFADREGYRISRAEEPRGDAVDFVATPVRRIEFDVRLPGGEQPARAMIHALSDSRSASMIWTPAEPSLEIDVADCDVRATFGALQSDRMFVGETKRPDRIVLRLAHPPGIHGRVILPDGWSVPHVVVAVASEEDFARTPFARLTTRRSARRDDGFSYSFVDLEPGRYVLAASIDGSETDAKAGVEVKESGVVRDLRIDSAVPPGYFGVRVVGPGGRPVGNARFLARTKGAVGQCTATRLGPGLYRVRPPAIVVRNASAFALTVGSKSYGEVQLQMAAGDRSPKEVRFAEAGSLEISIPGFARSEHRGKLRFRVRRAGTNARLRPTGRTGIDTQGVIRFAAVQPGEFEIRLGLDHDRLFWRLARRTLTVRQGANRIEFPIPVLHELRVVRDARPEDVRERNVGVELMGTKGDRIYRIVSIPTDGATTVTGLQPGRYELTGSTDRKPWKRTVTVPTETAVRLP